MLPHILIADPDEAFGLMLKQVLELNGNYSAEHVRSGELALAAARARQPDLVIVDMALTDVPPPTLISSIRLVAPETRSMLIPLNGTISEEVKAIGIQGTLSKPFFIGDLGEQIAGALGTEVKPLVIVPAPPEKAEPEMSASPENSGREIDVSKEKEELEINASPPPTSRSAPPLPAPSSRRAAPPPPSSRHAAPTRRVAASQGQSTPDGALMALAVEIRAEAVFLFRNGAVLAQRSEFSGARLERLVERVVSWRQAATDLAVLLGERGGFQRRQLEGERMLLVTYDIDPATFLLALCRSDVPLGTLRLHVRSAADRIARILPQQTSFASSPNTK